MLLPTLLIIISLQLTSVASSTFEDWNVTFSPSKTTVMIGEHRMVEFNLTGSISGHKKYLLTIQPSNPNLLDLSFDSIELNSSNNYYIGYFNISGIFLGKTDVLLKVTDLTTNSSIWEYKLPIKILRPQRTLDKIFTVSVAILVSLIYINFGCALNWDEMKMTLRRPFGPAIGLICQFLFMPLASYGLGKLLFPHDADMQLGIFFTGIAPGGGASNMWTVLLGGNIHLSITMTALSNFAAFAMMPLWVFTLGKSIFHSGDIPVPYGQISTYAAALVIPLLIGYLIRKYLQSVGEYLAKMLKGFASALLIFIVVFAIIVNYYLLKLFSWQLIISGLALPWFGYCFAFVVARHICRQNGKDSLTIAIETGIQNTGIAIFLLRFTLPQPEADITTIAPVSVATMTPIPLLLLFIIQRIKNRKTSKEISSIKRPEDESEVYQTIVE